MGSDLLTMNFSPKYMLVEFIILIVQVDMFLKKFALYFVVKINAFNPILHRERDTKCPGLYLPLIWLIWGQHRAFMLF